MNKNLKLALAVGALLFVVVLLIILFSRGGAEDNSYYEYDERSGLDFFVDPDQAPEVAGPNSVTLLNADDLNTYLYGDYLLQTRVRLYNYYKEKLSAEVGRAYVDGPVVDNEEQIITFFVETEEPVVSRVKVEAFIGASDIVEVTIKPADRTN